MRDLDIPVKLGPSSNANSVISITTASGFTAEELIRDNIIRDLPEAFLRLLSTSSGMDRAFSLRATATNRISINMSAGLISSQWQLASLVNLIDSSTFVGRLSGDPFITAIEIQSPFTDMASLSDLYRDLETANAQSDEAMATLLPAQFDLSSGLGRVWPQVPQDYFFQIVMAPTAPMDEQTQRAANAILLDFDSCVAGSAFEANEPPEVWFEQARIPYPVEFQVQRNEIEYRVEFPPSPISIGLLLVVQAFENHMIRIRNWTIDIWEGW